jgi:hypothetical protein
VCNGLLEIDACVFEANHPIGVRPASSHPPSKSDFACGRFIDPGAKCAPGRTVALLTLSKAPRK